MIAFLARERDMGNDALDRARDGRKDGRGQSLPRLCDERALFHLLPRLHDGNGGRADMLAERDIYLFGNRPLLDRRASGQVFGTRGMHPVLKRIHQLANLRFVALFFDRMSLDILPLFPTLVKSFRSK